MSYKKLSEIIEYNGISKDCGHKEIKGSAK